MKNFTHKPSIFIGSSSEYKSVADHLKLILDRFAYCSVWDQTFPLSHYTLETIIKNISESDFAIFILSDDDAINIRGNNFKISRDNVIFEAGLSIGILAKERTFLVIPTEKDLHLASDLLGFTVATYTKDFFDKNPMAAMGGAATQIENAIKKSLWANLNVTIHSKLLIDDREGTHDTLKLFMTLVNNESFPVTLESKNFTLKNFIVDKRTPAIKNYKPEFFAYRDVNTEKDIRSEIITLLPKKHTTTYIPIDPKTSFKRIKYGYLKNEGGIFDIRLIIHRNTTEIYNYSLEINSEAIDSNNPHTFTQDDLIGTWENNFDVKGSETLEIDNEFKYYINKKTDPSFQITNFKAKDNKVEFIKKSLSHSAPKGFENNLSIVDRNTLIGTENLIGEINTHNIRYNRI
jgi:hypothetical protein